jgi:hypothetical protein
MASLSCSHSRSFTIFVLFVSTSLSKREEMMHSVKVENAERYSHNTPPSSKNWSSLMRRRKSHTLQVLGPYLAILMGQIHLHPNLLRLSSILLMFTCDDVLIFVFSLPAIFKLSLSRETKWDLYGRGNLKCSTNRKIQSFAPEK